MRELKVAKMLYRAGRRPRGVYASTCHQTQGPNPYAHLSLSQSRPSSSSAPTLHNDGHSQSPNEDLIPQFKPSKFNREQLLRLLKLSALNPPAEGSDEEARLLGGLGELVGLMHLVKDVKLDADVKDLLPEGVGEVYIDGKAPTPQSEAVKAVSSDVGDARLQDTDAAGMDVRGEEKTGRDLLNWATRRVGNFYSHRAEQKQGSS